MTGAHWEWMFHTMGCPLQAPPNDGNSLGMDVSQNEGCPIDAGESIEIVRTTSDFDNLLEIVICVKHPFPMGSRHSAASLMAVPLREQPFPMNFLHSAAPQMVVLL